VHLTPPVRGCRDDANRFRAREPRELGGLRILYARLGWRGTALHERRLSSRARVTAAGDGFGQSRINVSVCSMRSRSSEADVSDSFTLTQRKSLGLGYGSLFCKLGTRVGCKACRRPKQK
jgi:hypothetical protein